MSSRKYNKKFKKSSDENEKEKIFEMKFKFRYDKIIEKII